VTAERPALSVVIPTRDGDIGRVADAVGAEVESVGGEVVVVDGREEGDLRMPYLRGIGVRRARGEIVAIGEDHAVPSPGWAKAVLDAHHRHDQADAVVGCLVNATDRKMSGRANFLAFAAAWAPPMPELPSGRPPPASTLSVKPRALFELGDGPGDFDSVLLPRLFTEGRMVADDTVVVFHHQDHGLRWAVTNAFASARSGYGYGYADRQPVAVADALRAGVLVARQLSSEVRDAQRRLGGGGGRVRPADLAVTHLVVAGAAAGAAVGARLGPGRAPERVA
jgi:hypothetical protein